jgi:hypothetical protein
MAYYNDSMAQGRDTRLRDADRAVQGEADVLQSVIGGLQPVICRPYRLCNCIVVLEREGECSNR